MSWTHLSDTQPKARKRHWCCLCEHAIDIGTVHVARRGIGDDGPLTMRMHTACESVAHDWSQLDWECHDASEFREVLKLRTNLDFIKEHQPIP